MCSRRAFDQLFLALHGTASGYSAFMAKASAFIEDMEQRTPLCMFQHTFGTTALPAVRAGVMAALLGEDPVRALRRREESGSSSLRAAVCVYELDNGVTIATRSSPKDACMVDCMLIATSYDDGLYSLQAEFRPQDVWAKLLHKLLADHARPGTRSDILLDQYYSMHFVLTQQRHRMCTLQPSFTGVAPDGNQSPGYFDKLVAVVNNDVPRPRVVPAGPVVTTLHAGLSTHFYEDEPLVFSDGPYFWPVAPDRMFWVGWFERGDGLMVGTCDATGFVL
jgi:hypothetical protein